MSGTDGRTSEAKAWSWVGVGFGLLVVVCTGEALVYLVLWFHALAHWLAARLLGLAPALHIGWGPVALDRTHEAGGWRVAVLPGVFGEAGAGFSEAPMWKRSAYLVSGPVASLVAGLALAWVFLFGAGLGPTERVEVDPERANVVSVVDASPAAVAGLVSGDRIVRVQGQETRTLAEVAAVLVAHEGTLEVVVSRDGAEHVLSVEPALHRDPVTGESRPALGVSLMHPGNAVVHHPSPAEAAAGANQMFARLPEVLRALGRSTVAPTRSIGGPVAVVDAEPEASLGPRVLWLAAMATLRATLMVTIWNLLPLPWSDGLHLTSELVRSWRGRPLPVRTIGRGGLGVLVLGLGGMTLVLVGTDLSRWLAR